MAQMQHTPSQASLEEALTVLFCLIDEEYPLLNPRAGRYEALKRLSDSEVLALALFQQLRGVESERSFLRDAQRFFSHLFPGVAGLCTPLPSTAACASSEASLSPCGARSLGSWWAIPRPSSSIRRFLRSCTRARSDSPRRADGL
jgi:hypothetical protein